MPDQQFAHDMLPRSTHDENARQLFCLEMRGCLMNDVYPNLRTVFEKRTGPAFKKEHGREAESRQDIRRSFLDDPFYRSLGASLRGTQELIWDSVVDTVERELPRLEKTFKESRRTNRGTLELDPDFETPRYLSAADNHCQPGNYYTENTEDDVSAGAIYDKGLFVYGGGRFGELNEACGKTVLDCLQRNYPEFRPKKILDMGCSVGHSTLPWVDAFPEADVYAIDVAAPMLRYGHARAESLGKVVHYSQQNAEHTSFDDGSMDLVVSHIMLHETSRKAFHNILKESLRLLRPGGLMLHMEQPEDGRFEDRFESFLWDWEGHNNNEVFAYVMRGLNFHEEAIKAGFDRDKTRLDDATYNCNVLIGEK